MWGPDEDGRALRDSAERLLRQEYAFDQHRQRVARQGGLDRALWARFAEMGWLSMMVPSSAGGLGLVETLGRHLVVEPYQDAALASTRLLCLLGDAAQQAQWLPGIADGSALTLLAHAESGARYALTCVQTLARREGDGWRIDGAKSGIALGHDADRLLVSARTSGSLDNRSGISLFAVERGAKGLSSTCYSGIDGTPLADLRFEGVRVAPTAQLGEEGRTFAAIDDAHALLLAAACVESIGVMQALLEASRDYAKTRRQFGTPLAGFQVISHRLVDMFTQVELSRSMAWLAVRQAIAQGPKTALTLSACKAHISAACRHVGEQAVQVHGGIGMTDELPASHFYRRLVAIERRLGDRFHHVGLLTEAVTAGSGLYA
jgi:alkylation response protein AidB-like acyl-CoA dehydrogenase